MIELNHRKRVDRELVWLKLITFLYSVRLPLSKNDSQI